jgi:hypothetical protein
MRLLIVAAAIVLSGCAGTTTADIQSSGIQTKIYHSEKTPMEFAACVIPIFDFTLKLNPSQMRPTATGVEVIKTGGVMGASVPFGVIKIDTDGTGSAVQGSAYKSLFGADGTLRKIDAAILGCLVVE